MNPMPMSPIRSFFTVWLLSIEIHLILYNIFEKNARGYEKKTGERREFLVNMGSFSIWVDKWGEIWYNQNKGGFVAPLFGIEMQGTELEPIAQPTPQTPPAYSRHPAQ